MTIGRTRWTQSFLVRAAAVGLLLSYGTQANASEGGVGFYLLGSKTSMAGYLPGPGVYASSSTYGYFGGADIDYINGGVVLSGDVDADAIIELPTLLWVLDQDIAGGHLAFSATAPFGQKSVNADTLLDTPRGSPISLNYERDNFALGDPVLGASLGWHTKKVHYSVQTLVNVPIGQWERGNPVSMGFHRWAFDATGAVTYLDPASGLEVSGAAGVTFNLENEDTDYQTGTELHFEAAVMKHLSHTTAVGIQGYAFEQVSGDSGTGAKLGPFKGEVFAIGPTLDHTFVIGRTPVVTSLRYFHEFGAENRLEGDAVFLNVVIPLHVTAPAGH